MNVTITSLGATRPVSLLSEHTVPMYLYPYSYTALGYSPNNKGKYLLAAVCRYLMKNIRGIYRKKYKYSLVLS